MVFKKWVCPGFNDLSWFCFACGSSLTLNTVSPCEYCLPFFLPLFPPPMLSNKNSDSWHSLQQYTQAGLFIFLRVGLSLWKLNQCCPFGCQFACDGEIVPLCFAWSFGSDWTCHPASKLCVTSLFVMFQRAYGYVVKNGYYSHSRDLFYWKNALCFPVFISCPSAGR